MRRFAVVCLIVSLITVEARAQVALAKLKIHQAAPPTFTWYGWVAYLDLSARFEPMVRGSATAACGYWPSVTLLDTLTYANDRDQVLVAITANSGTAAAGAGNGTCTGNVAGMIVSNGQIVSPPQQNGPTLYFVGTDGPRIDVLSSFDTRIQWAVSGSTSTDNDCGGPPGTLLVKDGRPGNCVVPKAGSFAARGAAGLTKDRRVLILVVVQGNEELKNGMNTRQFADLMIDLGADSAVNFDGGGSTAFIWKGSRYQNLKIEASLYDLIGSGRGLTVTSERKDLRLDYCSTATQDTPCNDTKAYRPVYAQLGFVYIED
jgi:hypothetical protein